MSIPPGYTVHYGIELPDGTMAMSPYGAPWLWDDIEAAERALGYFRYTSGRLGIADWTGRIKRRLCSPWIGELDSADGLIEELSAWLERETGDGS